MKRIKVISIRLESRHKWKIEVGTISAEFNCSDLRTVGGTGPATLKLSSTLDEKESGQVSRGESFSKKALVELKKDGETLRLWPVLLGHDNKTINITKDHSKKQLKIVVTKLGKPQERGNGHLMASTTGESEMACDATGLFGSGRGSGGVLYQGIMKQRVLGQWTSEDSVPLKVSISLRTCNLDEDKKTANDKLQIALQKDSQKPRNLRSNFQN